MPQATLADALTTANPNNIADALRLVDLGRLLTPISVLVNVNAQTVILDPPPLSAAVVTARVNEGDDPGLYVCTDNGVARIAPAGGVGIAVLTDPNVLTFASTVGSVVLNYIATPKTSLSAPFSFAAP